MKRGRGDGHGCIQTSLKSRTEKVDEKGAKAREKRTALRSRMENRFLLMMRMRINGCVCE
jgi:hypothetical protein